MTQGQAAHNPDQDLAGFYHWLQERLAPGRGSLQVLGIAGPSGVGKSTLAGKIAAELRQSNWITTVLGMDEFFKGPADRDQLGEWGPDHVRLEELERILAGLVEGQKELHTWRYVRKPEARLEPWTIAVPGLEILILEGLYVLSPLVECADLLRFVDHAIYLDAPESLLKTWRFQQEAAKPRGRSLAAMEHHWSEGIVPDTRDRVAPSKRHADLILEKDAFHCYHLRDSLDLPLP